MQTANPVQSMLEKELADAMDLMLFFKTTSTCIYEGVQQGMFPGPKESINGKPFWRVADIRDWMLTREKLKHLVKN